ncbi:PstS family phosphate ABC transporter substrate-binding protein [Haliscomenobacter sp.]|uniref:PstS family phosphate ABC transporter substrate-binding protein n=1 Tax=Haliscomenobacter sp. TaxID=2717303 RepID=UPI003BAD7A40
MSKYIHTILIGGALFAFACNPNHHKVENILIKGSDTEVNLALALAETYMSTDPDVSIAVTGGGSGAGIAALINGKTSIANASRPMKWEEIALANERKVQPLASVLGMDAIAIVVHPQCPVQNLSLQQLGAIYRGDIQNWKTLGGPDAEISLYGRQSNSGTFVYFRDSIVRAEYAQEVKQMNGTAQIVEAIKNDVHGIGYVGVGYILEKSGARAGIKVLPIGRSDHQPAFLPTEVQNIESGDYPIIRPLYQYTNGQPKGRLHQYLQYCLSPAGQALVKASGYFPVSAQYQLQNEQALNYQYAKSTLR